MTEVTQPSAVVYESELVNWAKARDPVAWLIERDSLTREIAFWEERCKSLERLIRTAAEFVYNPARVK